MSNGRSSRPRDNGEDNPATNGNTPAGNGSLSPVLTEPVNKAIQQYEAYILALGVIAPAAGFILVTDTSKQWSLPPLNPNLSSD